jgi:hypothetical protein
MAHNKEHEYIESDIPQDQQKNKGWYWHYPEGKFYRWDMLLEKCREHDLQHGT